MSVSRPRRKRRRYAFRHRPLARYIPAIADCKACRPRTTRFTGYVQESLIQDCHFVTVCRSHRCALWKRRCATTVLRLATAAPICLKCILRSKHVPPWRAFLSCRQSLYTGSKRSPSDAGVEGASRPDKRERAGPAHRGFSGPGDSEKWDAMKVRTDGAALATSQ